MKTCQLNHQILPMKMRKYILILPKRRKKMKRKLKLTDEGGFRVPIGAPKGFQRGFKQRYSSEVHVVKDIKGSVVEAEDGKKQM